MISLGIDTSCYTTSMVVMRDSKILYEGRRLLEVKEGTVGLRQADAFFQHVKNLPDLYDEISDLNLIKDIQSVVVSDKPRPIEGSYMPVFTAGVNFSRIISKSLNIPLYYLSHQENHLYAGLYDIDILDHFIGVHISGGTSEILKVDYHDGFEIEIVDETLDISFGKLIDRLGVYMGLSFPCGKALDDLAVVGESYPLKMSIKEKGFNISGIENQLKTFYDADKDAGKVSYTLFEYIGNLLYRVIKKSMETTGYEIVVMSGGVAANSVIRDVLKEKLKKQIIFTHRDFATDHSVGNAFYGTMRKTDET